MTRILLLAALLGLALAPAAARAHTTVERTSPAADDTLAASPPEIRLRFTARVEPALTVLTLVRGGAHVAAGGSVVEGSGGREYVLPLTAALPPGSYQVRWRTAGADGHVLEGSWSFVVEGEQAAAAPQLDTAAAAPAAAGDAPQPVQPLSRTGGPVGVAVRWLWFASLLGMVGAAAFRFGVLRRLARDEAHREVAVRAEGAVWFVALAAAALSVLSLLGRLWVQAQSLGGGSAWDGEQLEALLTRTSWGLAWTLQAIATVAFFVGLMIVRAPHGRSAGWLGATVAAVLLAAVPALSGHAVGVEGANGLAILSDALHVLGAGVWLGTLAAVLGVGIPAALSTPGPSGAAVAALVSAFSPLALAGAALVAVTGVANTVFQLGALPDLWTTAYGRTLLVKLALLAVVAALGFHHWRRAGPALGSDEAVPPIRRSIRAELALGALVLLATAVLVALPTP